MSALTLVREQVRNALEREERCRNSDRYLYVFILEEFYDVSQDTPLCIWITADCPDYESVRRCRNLIQSAGEFPPTDPEVAKRRGRSMATGKHDGTGRAEEVRESLGYPVPTGDSLFGDTSPRDFGDGS